MITGATLTATGTVSHDEANAIEKSLGVTHETSVSQTINYDMVQGKRIARGHTLMAIADDDAIAPNTFAKLTFVPFMDCKKYTMSCTDGDHEVEHCRSKEDNAGYGMLMYTG